MNIPEARELPTGVPGPVRFAYWRISRHNNRTNILLLILGPIALAAGVVHLVGGDQRNAVIQLAISVLAFTYFAFPAAVWWVRVRRAKQGQEGSEVVPPWRPAT